MGKAEEQQTQEPLWIAHAELASAPGHPFYEKLNELLEADARGGGEAYSPLPPAVCVFRSMWSGDSRGSGPVIPGEAVQDSAGKRSAFWLSPESWTTWRNPGPHGMESRPTSNGTMDHIQRNRGPYGTESVRPE